MKLKVWSKTLLNIYSCLFRLTREIDKIILSYALKSGFYNGICKTYNDIEKMIELTDRKVTLINLKVLIEKSLVSLDKTSCKILTLKYIDKVSNETIYKVLNIKRRTFYRKYIQALSSFGNQLLINGFDINNVNAFVKDETWILDIFNNFLDKEINKSAETEISKYSIYNIAVNNFKKSKHYEYSFIA